MWLKTILARKAGLVPGVIGDDESHEDYAERMRVTAVPPPPQPTGPATDALQAGWHPDPFGRHEHRFFDGVEWTENVADAGTAAIDPVPADVKQPA